MLYHSCLSPQFTVAQPDPYKEDVLPPSAEAFNGPSTQAQADVLVNTAI